MITPKEMAEEMERLVLAPGRVTFIEVAESVIRLIQSRAAGVQGADELLRSENPDRKDFTVDEALRIADQNDAAYKHAPSVSRTLAAEVRRLATPQPPKDAGAVPMPAEPVLFDDRTGEWGFDADQLRAYGDAREASGRADSVLSFNREHAAKRIADSILRSPTNNTDENNDSVALLDVLANAFGDKTVGPAMDWMIDAVFVALEDFPQHPPAEPAARAQPIDEDHPENWPAWLQDLVASTAQTATDAARAQVVGYRWRNSDHQPWTLGETVSGFDLNSREIGAAIEPLGVVNQQLTAGDVARADLVPGVMHCAKCKFRVHRTTLYMGSGTTGPGDNKTEPCPNGCGPLWPVTWEQEAREAMALANGLHEQLQAAQQQGEEKIACDVKVAPATTFRAGVSLSTVVRAIRSRAEWAAKEGDGPYVFLGKTDHIEDKLGMVAASRDRVSEIEDAVASGAMNAMQCFTQMRQLIVKPDHSAGVGVSLHRKARALLAAEYDRDGQAFVADRIRTDAMLTHVEDRSLRAIVSALAQPADAEAAPNG